MRINHDFILGLGIGLLVSALLMAFAGRGAMTDYEIEERARDLGMVHPGEIKAGAFYEEATE